MQAVVSRQDKKMGNSAWFENISIWPWPLSSDGGKRSHFKSLSICGSQLRAERSQLKLRQSKWRKGKWWNDIFSDHITLERVRMEVFVLSCTSICEKSRGERERAFADSYWAWATIHNIFGINRFQYIEFYLFYIQSDWTSVDQL